MNYTYKKIAFIKIILWIVIILTTIFQINVFSDEILWVIFFLLWLFLISLFTGYFHTIKWPQKYLENDKKITSQDYTQYELMKALNTDKIIKDREYFLYDDQYFSFDTFKYPKHRLQPGDIWLMEIEKTHADQEVRIPSFMEVENVTNDRRYTNAAIAWYKKTA